MKTILVIAFAFSVVPVFCQDADSLAVVRAVDSLIKESRMLLRQRDYDRALDVNTAAQNLALEKLGRESAQYAFCCSFRGAILSSKGDYSNAEKWYHESITIREKTVGKGHLDYARSLFSLGILYERTGQYEKVELLYVESNAIMGKALGKDHVDYAWSLTSLANWYSTMGNYEKAEPLYHEAKTILEKTYGKNHPEYATSLINLADLYFYMGNYEKTEPTILEAIEILEKMQDEEAYLYATSLEALGILYESMGKYEKALPLYIETKTIREKILGKVHYNYAGVLYNLASLYKKMGKYEEAELLNLEALAILEKILGKEHPEYAVNLNNLINLYEIQHRFSVSEPMLAELFALEQARLLKASTFLSEQELAQYTATFQKIGDKLGSYILARLPGETTGALPNYAFGHALFQKGFLLNAAAQLNTLSAASPESEKISILLKGYRRRLAAEYAKPIAERKNVAELEEKANTLEKELARMVAGYGEALRQVNWQEVQSALKPGEAAIEFIRFHYYNPNPTNSTLYAALLVKPGMGSPAFIGLFEEKQLSALLAPLAGQGSGGLNELYGGQAGQSLYRLLWSPLEPHLAGVKTLYYSPSGLLHRLNLGAIAVAEGKILADRYELVCLSSTRQLVTAPTFVPSAGKPATATAIALVYGGIQFDMDSTAYTTRGYPQSSDSGNRGGLSFGQSDSTLRGDSWQFLKWSEKEADNVQNILSKAGIAAETRKDWQATEESFKQIGSPLQGDKKSSPRILHVSTHGFFFPDPKEAVNRGPSAVDREPVFKISDHPMIRSGLILAGGNYAWKTGQPLGNREDGILTAYEISQLDLRNTDLVVLSACETGLGQIEGNEGVYGLQRAFKIAGAKHLVMSLWQVPDYQTQELMTVFYSNMLEKEMPVRQALHAAQDEMRQKRYEPFYWAGFVLIE